MIQIVNFKFKIPENSVAVNTTSRSTNWSRGLSPFFLGPCEVYDGYVSKTMENLWQYSKCYPDLSHIGEDGNPTPEYFKWAQKGWESAYAQRYPNSRNAIPAYSYWNGEKLDYVSARKKIYIPMYAKTVIKTEAFAQLEELYNQTIKDNNILYLIDFDSHNLTPPTDYWKLINNPNIKVGHAYVLAMLLERKLNE